MFQLVFQAFVLLFAGAFLAGLAKAIIQNKSLIGGAAATTWAVFAALFLALLIWMAPWEPDEPLTAEQEARRADAQAQRSALAACASYVRGAVKLPDSLEFTYNRDRASKTESGNWLVIREFIAENSLGGRVRSTARCLYDGNKLLSAEISEP